MYSNFCKGHSVLAKANCFFVYLIHDLKVVAIDVFHFNIATSFSSWENCNIKFGFIQNLVFIISQINYFTAKLQITFFI